MSDMLSRIEREAGVPDLAALLSERLTAADLHSLLLEVYRRRAAARTAAAVLAEYQANRFVHPARVDPRLLLEWDRVAYAALPYGFAALELSPLCPLGTSSAVVTISQNRSVVTARNLEVVSDPTNVLALECAARRRGLLATDARCSEPVRLAASHRTLRPQFYGNPRLLPHFRLFSLCTAGRDTGAGRFENEALSEHVRFYVHALRSFLGPDALFRVLITDLSSEAPSERLAAGCVAPLQQELPGTEFGFDQQRTSGRGYYRSVCFHVYAVTPEKPVELADGGDVDWTQKLVGSAKERLFISGIGSERVCGLRGGYGDSHSPR